MKTRKCSKCKLAGHDRRTCTGISTEEVQAAIEAGSCQIEERFPETGFVYYEGGRVFWKLEDTAPKGCLSITKDDVWINESWGCPSRERAHQLYSLLTLYVNWCRQGKRAELAEKSPLHQLVVGSE